MDPIDNETTADYDQIAGAHGLLASYPFASATPTSHAARHLGPLSLTSPIPSIAHPTLSAMTNSLAQNAYSDTLHGPVPSDVQARQIWEQHREAVIRGLQAESQNIQLSHEHHRSTTATASTALNSETHWAPSNYQVSPLSSSVLHSVASHPAQARPPLPPNLMPTPSSLSNALGHQSMPPQTSARGNPVYAVDLSSEFFEDFLSSTMRQMDAQKVYAPAQSQNHFASPQPRPSSSPTAVGGNSPSASPISTRAPSQHPKQQHQHHHERASLPAQPSTPTRARMVPYVELTRPSESPDPLALVAGQTSAYLNAGQVTPSRKRKSAEPHTPHGVKRVHPASAMAPPVSMTNSLAASRSGPSATTYDYGDGSESEGYTDADAEGEVDMIGATPSTVAGSARKGARRGKMVVNQDGHVPLQKLTTLIDEIFEAEDSIAPDSDVSSLPSAFFSHLTSDASRPLLSYSIIGKLTHLIGQVRRPSKRSRRQAMATPRKPGGEPEMVESLSQLDPAILGRLLKLLERSVVLGEDLDPFAGPPSSASGQPPPPSSPSKKGKANGAKTKKGKTGKTKESASAAVGTRRSSRSRSRSRSHQDGEESDAEPDTTTGNQVPNGGFSEPAEDELEQLGHALDVVRESVAAAACSIALLAADALSKQLYSEELILSCLSTVKNQLDKAIYPFAEGLGDIHGHNSAILEFTLRSASQASIIHRKQIGEIFNALSAAFPHIDSLVRRASASSSNIAMSDAITIQIVYISIGPFFVVESSSAVTTSKAAGKEKSNVVLNALGGIAALRGLRLSALSLIRSVFETSPEQRGWIVDEILTSLIKLPDLKQKAGQFRLRDGRAIHTVTALLLQLVQTSAHDTALQAREFIKKRRELAVQSSMATPQVQEQVMLDVDKEEASVYASSLDGPYNIGKSIFVFLTSRVGKGKGSKTANETEYRAILDTLLSDLLTVLYWPEWPGAALMLVVASKILGKALDDVKSSAAASTDTNGLRAIALDCLGSIAARLRSSQLRNVKSEEDPVAGLPSLDTIMAKADIPSLEILIAAHEEVITHLTKFSSEDAAINESAREMTTSIWAHDLAVVIARSEAALARMVEQGVEKDAEYASLTTAVTRLRSTLRSIWKPAQNDVFAAESNAKRIDVVSEIISVSQVLKHAFEPILNIIISSLDASAVFMRTKGLRALGQVIIEDPIILRSPNVRHAIANHLQDSSPQVRDAAVELIGKYIISMPNVANDYYQQIAERIADTGLGVRKRVIKLFKSIYASEESIERRIDICTKLVMRMLDEDDTVKDLASKTIGELWFSTARDETSVKASKLPARATLKGETPPVDPFNSKVSVIMGVVAKFPDRQSPLEDLLHQLAMTSEGQPVQTVLSQYEDVCKTLMEDLVDGSSAQGSSVINAIKAIHIFATAHPSVITSPRALTLLPYLKNPSNAEEQTISDYLLKIYRLCIPTMPKTALKFGQELQTTLQPMVIKPSSAGGITALQETVATLCVTVKHLTHNFSPLIGLLKSCNAKLQATIRKSSEEQLAPAMLTQVILLIYIISLLCEHCDFDILRESDHTLAPNIDTITKDRVNEHVYTSLLALHKNVEDPSTRSRIMQCLGFLFRAYPALMTTDESAELMDTVFSAADFEARARLLRIIQDFLMSESSKFMAQEKGVTKAKSSKKDVNMEELVGNTTGFAESGVSSAIVQRYFVQILDCCVTNHPVVQSSAIDILGFVVRQGLAHPIQCVSTIIALETSPSHSVSLKALNYHTLLYNKHATMINARHIESARKSFEYQQRLNGPVSGYRTSPSYSARLNGWYSLVREKRATRQDWLKALVKALDIEVSPVSMSQFTADFIRYMIENFAALEYKTQEEVLTVIRHVTSVLSVAGVYTADILLQATDEKLDSSQPVPEENNVLYSIDFSRSCTCVAMLLLLKSHLKAMYGLTEDKCSKWIPGKKSAIGDKPAVRRHETPINWDRLPFATTPIIAYAQQEEQHRQLLVLWEEEGVSPEPVEDVE